MSSREIGFKMGIGASAVGNQWLKIKKRMAEDKRLADKVVTPMFFSMNKGFIQKKVLPFFPTRNLILFLMMSVVFEKAYAQTVTPKDLYEPGVLIIRLNKISSSDVDRNRALTLVGTAEKFGDYGDYFKINLRNGLTVDQALIILRKEHGVLWANKLPSSTAIKLIDNRIRKWPTPTESQKKLYACRFTVVFNQNVSSLDRDRILKPFKKVRKLNGVNGYERYEIVLPTASEVNAAVSQLRMNPLIHSVNPDPGVLGKFGSCLTPSNQYFNSDYEWPLYSIDAPEAWENASWPTCPPGKTKGSGWTSPEKMDT